MTHRGLAGLPLLDDVFAYITRNQVPIRMAKDKSCFCVENIVTASRKQVYLFAIDKGPIHG